jgi:hypothetical protein
MVTYGEKLLTSNSIRHSRTTERLNTKQYHLRKTVLPDPFPLWHSPSILLHVDPLIHDFVGWDGIQRVITFRAKSIVVATSMGVWRSSVELGHLEQFIKRRPSPKESRKTTRSNSKLMYLSREAHDLFIHIVHPSLPILPYLPPYPRVSSAPSLSVDPWTRLPQAGVKRVVPIQLIGIVECLGSVASRALVCQRACKLDWMRKCEQLGKVDIEARRRRYGKTTLDILCRA